MIRRLITLAFALPALLLAGCMDQDLPTGMVAPTGPLFDHAVGHCEVTTTNDAGPGSLRAALSTSTCTTITFGVTGTITLTSSYLSIPRNLTITGPGADQLTVARSSAEETLAFRIFLINPGVIATISGLTITNGNGTPGGGGIYNAGTLTLTNSTVSGNSASGGAGIYNAGTLTLNHSMVSDNSASGGNGGGISNSSTGTLTLNHSTVAANSATVAGGGIFNAATLTLRSSLVAGNNATTAGPDINAMSGIATASYSLIGSPAGHTITATEENGNLVGTATVPLDPKLGPLQGNGGPTRTHALLAGSPAIDHVPQGTNGCGLTGEGGVTDDQRGTTRPQGRGCDIGAFELEHATPLAFGGFLPPVRTGQINVVKAGSAVPVKFSLGGDFGLEIFAIGYPRSEPLASCGSGIGEAVATTTAGASSLAYDAGTDQYTYIWKTDKGWAGTCRRFEVRFLGDANSYTVDFSFTR